VHRRRPDDEPGIADTYRLACLAGIAESGVDRGPVRAVAAAVAALRASASILVTRHGNTGATGPEPAGVAPLVNAVYHAAARHLPQHGLVHDAAVAAALAPIQRGLVDAHWVPTDRENARWRRAGPNCLGMFALGVALLVAMIAFSSHDGNSLDLVAFLTFVVAAPVLFLSSVGLMQKQPPAIGRPAVRLLTTLRRSHARLRPPATPSFDVIGPEDAALAVALFGYAALQASDPVWTGVPRAGGS
jgi:uncharacterized protein (TIGR04222 family)